MKPATPPPVRLSAPPTGYFNDEPERQMFTKAEPGVRVVQRYRFGQQGTVVAVYLSWAWVMWDEYPPEHEPTTHHLTTLALARPKPVENSDG